jgi:hypothetical protein
VGYKLPPQLCVLLSLAVPLVTHLHGQNTVNDYSDGYPEVSSSSSSKQQQWQL